MREKPSDIHPKKLDVKTATIALGASLSDIIDLGAGTPVSIEMPAGWDAANLTFKTGTDGITHQNYYDAADTEVSIPTAAARNIRLNPSDFAGVQFIQIRSGTAAVPVPQTAARQFRVVVRVI